MKSILEKIENKISNKIGVISLILALGSFITCMLSMYVSNISQLRILSHIFSYVDISIMNLDIFNIWSVTSGSEGVEFTVVNGLNVAFYFVFLLASLIYILSKKKEKRLLQFSYAIIYFSVWMFFLVYFFSQFRNFTLFDPLGILSLARGLVLLILSYVILKATDKTIIVQEKNTYLESESNVFIKASKYKRFIHLIVDALLYIGLTFKVFPIILPIDFLNGMVNLLGDRLALTILFIFSAIVYYVIFEVQFKRTPGKYLTQAFVIGVKKPIVTKDIIVRSLSRKIPLNTFSFLGKTGWHDAISKTTVVSFNKSKGDYKYWLLIPVIGLFFFLNYQFNEFRGNENNNDNEYEIVILE